MLTGAPGILEAVLRALLLTLSRQGWLRHWVERSRAGGTRVEIDMESSEYVDRTLAIVSDLHARHASVRAVIQAYLYRSEADIEKLCAQSIPVRLCKGAYDEPAAVAWPKKADVD